MRWGRGWRACRHAQVARAGAAGPNAVEGHGQGQDCIRAVLDTAIRGCVPQHTRLWWVPCLQRPSKVPGDGRLCVLAGLDESLGPPGYRCRPPQTCHNSGQPLLLPYRSIIEKFATVSSSVMNSGSSAPRQRHASASCVHQQSKWHSNLLI